jgi:hypothetical protein
MKDTEPVWDRQATREWIAQLELRVEDIRYYMERTIEWCELNEIYDDRTVFACVVMTAVWVSHMRAEPITKHELFEMLGVEGWDKIDDAIYEFNEDYAHLDHESLLKMVAYSF